MLFTDSLYPETLHKTDSYFCRDFAVTRRRFYAFYYFFGKKSRRAPSQVGEQ